MSDQYEAIVVGAGHNGLTAAAYLAHAGWKTLVLERRPVVGGVAATEEFAPGYWVDSVLHDAGTFSPTIARDLFLKMQGLDLRPADPVIFAPQPDGRALTLWRDPHRSAAEIAHFSAHDAAQFAAYATAMHRYVGFLERVFHQAPPNVAALEDNDVLGWLGVGGAFRLLGDRGMYELLRALPMALVEFMDLWFEAEAVRGALGMAGTPGANHGPYAAGTTLQFLYHHLGHRANGLPATAHVRGGIGQLATALTSIIEYAGGQVRTDASVARIMRHDGRTSGVILENGDAFTAPVVLSSTNPRHTFLDLVDPYELDPSFTRALDNIKFRGTTAKVNLALDGLPTFAALPTGETARLNGRIVICPGLDYLERAADAAKYGAFSPQPALDIRIPTLHDPSLAPAGHHVMSILVKYAPYRLREGDWTMARQALAQTVRETLQMYAPDLVARIVHEQVLTPGDLAERFGLADAGIYHGQMSLDQLLFMRPIPGWASYRTPIPGLYFGGAGAHPGGGVTGIPGKLAAQTILQDRKNQAM